MCGAVTGEGSVPKDAVLYNTPSYLTLTLESLPTEELLEMASTIDKRERATELSSLSSQVDDTSYRPSSPSTINDEDTNINQTLSLSPSSNDTNTHT